MTMRFVRYAGEPRSEDAEYADALHQNAVVLDPWSTADENIEAHFVLDRRRAAVGLSPLARDLFDLGAMVYIADEIMPRVASDDLWTRTFPFIFPVAEPEVWRAAGDTLVSCLSFLSGDRYEFVFMQRPPSSPGGISHRTKLSGSYDAVCLFSGGVDSLLGAASLLEAGKRVLLVGHYADGVTSSAQRDLFALLARKYRNLPTLLQVNVTRSLKRTQRFVLPEKREITHRSRSFLFLTAAAAVATVVGTKQLYIPENGLIAINAPLGASRQGTLSTRTAHPRFIARFNELLRTLRVDVHVDNPFSHVSKTDMVQAVSDPELRDALVRSVSCAHAGNLRWEGDSSITHCGYCVPCLYRRAGFLAAGIDEPGYLFDVYSALPEMTADTARDFRLLVRFARFITTASEAQVLAALLRHGAFTAGAAGEEYEKRAAMLRRWATSFVEQARSRATANTRRIVGL